MQTLGLSDIQKNISVLSKLKEPLKIIDKRKKIVVAIVYPTQNKPSIQHLAGKYESRIDPSLKKISLSKAKKKAFELAMSEKYGQSD